MREIRTDVYARLKQPMLTLMAGGVFEQGFACLKHIALLTSRQPDTFAADSSLLAVVQALSVAGKVEEVSSTR